MVSKKRKVLSIKIPLHYQVSNYDCGPTSLVNALRGGGAHVDGEGFVAHTKDKVEFFPAGAGKFFQHGEPIEKMTGVDHEGYKIVV